MSTEKTYYAYFFAYVFHFEQKVEPTVAAV